MSAPNRPHDGSKGQGRSRYTTQRGKRLKRIKNFRRTPLEAEICKEVSEALEIVRAAVKSKADVRAVRELIRIHGIAHEALFVARVFPAL